MRIGCDDGHHTAWIIVEAENDAEARLMVPFFVRNTALVCKLNKFTLERIRELHPPATGRFKHTSF